MHNGAFGLSVTWKIIRPGKIEIANPEGDKRQWVISALLGILMLTLIVWEDVNDSKNG